MKVKDLVVVNRNDLTGKSKPLTGFLEDAYLRGVFVGGTIEAGNLPTEDIESEKSKYLNKEIEW